MTTRHLLLAKLLTGAACMHASGAHATVSASDLAGPIREYRSYVTENLQGLATDTRAFTDAVKAGDIEEAKRLYAPTRAWYERIEPVADLFGDLDGAIDSRADDHEEAERDSGFGGFHRIEYALWVKASTGSVEDTADRLLLDVLELQNRLKNMAFPPEKMVGGAAALMEEVAATKISGEENRYSHADLSDIQANFEGARKIVELLHPFIMRSDTALLARIDTNFISVFDTLNTYRTPDGGFQSYTQLTAADRKMLTGRINTLAEDLSRLRSLFGLN